MDKITSSPELTNRRLDVQEGSHLWRPYCQMATAAPAWIVASADGNYLILEDGRRLLDGISSWWTACHGHRHPHIIASMKAQLDVLPHVMLGGLSHKPAMRLAERLADLLPGDLDYIFFVDSGSVAVEVAMKMAVQYWMNRGQSGRNRFVSFANSYHGDTSGAMSVCDPDDSMHSHFKGFLLEQFPLAIPAAEDEFKAFSDFLDEHRDNLAGVIIEPLIQAACGLRFHSSEQLNRIATIVREKDLLLICDEIATGFGRTGRMFAVEWADVVPDIMCIGKGLSGGVISLAAAVASQRVFDAFWSTSLEAALMHGPTYMGNPLACAAANASLDLFEREPYSERVAMLESIAKERLLPLGKLTHVEDVRILGGFAAVQMQQNLDKERWMQFFVERGCWLRPTRDVFYLAPPFTTSSTEMNTLCDAITAAVAAF